MRRIHYHQEAILDLEEVSERIALHNLDASIEFCLALEADTERLAEFPGMGTRRRFRKSSFTELRCWQVKGFRDYLIFYQPTSDGIEIVNIVHAARNLDALFDNR